MFSQIVYKRKKEGDIIPEEDKNIRRTEGGHHGQNPSGNLSQPGEPVKDMRLQAMQEKTTIRMLTDIAVVRYKEGQVRVVTEAEFFNFRKFPNFENICMIQTAIRARQGLGAPIFFTFEAPPDIKRHGFDSDMIGDTGYDHKKFGKDDAIKRDEAA